MIIVVIGFVFMILELLKDLMCIGVGIFIVFFKCLIVLIVCFCFLVIKLNCLFKVIEVFLFVNFINFFFLFCFGCRIFVFNKVFIFGLLIVLGIKIFLGMKCLFF